MPKQVDVNQRLAQIHAAVLRLIVAQGVPAASFRNVADEAGLNIGSVRHYVGTQEAMVRGAAEYAIAGVRERIARRTASYPSAGSSQQLFDVAVDLLLEIVPLDDQRRVEAILWLAFTEHARISGDSSGIASEMAGGIRTFTTGVLRSVGAPQVAVAGEAMASVLDGLVIAILREPEAYPPDRVREIVSWQLNASL